MSSISAMGVIKYRWAFDAKDHVRVWRIGAHATENDEESLRDHLARWRPAAIFISAEVIPDEDDAKAKQLREGGGS